MRIVIITPDESEDGSGHTEVEYDMPETMHDLLAVGADTQIVLDLCFVAQTCIFTLDSTEGNEEHA